MNIFTDNYFWLLSSKNNHFATIVDPGDSKPVLNTLQNEQLILESILVTHHHNDHVGGNIDLKKKYHSKVICPSYEVEKIPGADIKKGDGEQFNLGETDFKVIHLPGHTLGLSLIHI